MSEDRPTHIVLRPKNGMGLQQRPRQPESAATDRASRPVATQEDDTPLVLLDGSPRSRTAAAGTEAQFFAKKKAAKRRAPESGRDYIIAYDGSFIGHYRAPRPTTGRVALEAIAERLADKIGSSFELSKLSLFKPVKIRVRREAIDPEVQHGVFDWFGESPAAP